MSSLAWLAVALGLVLSFDVVAVDSYQPNERVSTHDSNRFDVQVYGGVTTKPFYVGTKTFDRDIVNITYIGESSTIDDFLEDVCWMTTQPNFNLIVVYGYGAPGLRPYCKKFGLGSSTTFGGGDGDVIGENNFNGSDRFDVMLYAGVAMKPFNVGTKTFDRSIANITFEGEPLTINTFIDGVCWLTHRADFNVVMIYAYRASGSTTYCDKF